jgi:hypothetical protein
VRTPRFLPIAPRPFEGELLSSWQERVACRYGRTTLELEHWLDPGADGGWTVGFERRDFNPDDAMIAAWARACRLPASRLAEMALSRRARPLAWYIAERRHRAVCPACLDEDAARDRDHYVRLAWAHVEASVCSRHRQILRDFCGRCFSRVGFRFHGLAGQARLVCGACSVVVSCGQADAAEPEKLEFPLALANAVTAVVDGHAGGASSEDIMRAARWLWAPSQADKKPFIAWFGLGLPTGWHGMPAELAAPLATASLAWRIATLIGVAQLLDLADARRRFGPPPTFLLQAFAAEPDGGSRPASRSAVRPSGETETPATKLKLRSDAEYRALAEAILASPDWKRVERASAATRGRVLGRLMTQALDRAPRARAAVPGRAAP